MKILISIIFLLFTFEIFSQEVEFDSSEYSLKLEEPHTLTINIVGISNDNGFIMLAMSDNKENYEDFENPKYREILPIKDRQCVVKFNNIPYGDYAVKVYHDEDSDEELDKNFLGIPTEDYGFSNNPNATMGPASWEDARFSFNKDLKEITINIE